MCVLPTVARPSCARRRRRGFTTFELLVTTLLLVGVFSLVGVAVRRSLTHARSIDDRRAAIETAAIALERLSAEPWDRLLPQRAEAIAEEVELPARLREPRLELTIDEPNDRGGKRVVAAVSWANAPQPVRLATWLHEPEASP